MKSENVMFSSDVGLGVGLGLTIVPQYTSPPLLTSSEGYSPSHRTLHPLPPPAYKHFVMLTGAADIYI